MNTLAKPWPVGLHVHYLPTGATAAAGTGPVDGIQELMNVASRSHLQLSHRVSFSLPQRLLLTSHQRTEPKARRAQTLVLRTQLDVPLEGFKHVLCLALSNDPTTPAAGQLLVDIPQSTMYSGDVAARVLGGVISLVCACLSVMPAMFSPMMLDAGEVTMFTHLLFWSTISAPLWCLASLILACIPAITFQGVLKPAAASGVLFLAVLSPMLLDILFIMLLVACIGFFDGGSFAPPRIKGQRRSFVSWFRARSNPGDPLSSKADPGSSSSAVVEVVVQTDDDVKHV